MVVLVLLDEFEHWNFVLQSFLLIICLKVYTIEDSLKDRLFFQEIKGEHSLTIGQKYRQSFQEIMCNKIQSLLLQTLCYSPGVYMFYNIKLIQCTLYNKVVHSTEFCAEVLLEILHYFHYFQTFCIARTQKMPQLSFLYLKCSQWIKQSCLNTNKGNCP